MSPLVQFQRPRLMLGGGLAAIVAAIALVIGVLAKALLVAVLVILVLVLIVVIVMLVKRLKESKSAERLEDSIHSQARRDIEKSSTGQTADMEGSLVEYRQALEALKRSKGRRRGKAT